MASFPVSIVAFTNPSGTNLLTTPDHALMHSSENNEIIAIENKLGQNSGSAANNQILVGVGAGSTTWGTVWTGGSIVTPNIAGGTITNASIGGTFNNGVLGSPTITSGTINSVLLGTPTINNSTLGTFTAKGIYNCGTVSGLGTVNWANGDRQVYTLSASGTMAFINPGTGQILNLEILQNSTGGYSLAFPTMKWPYGVSGTIGTAANSINILTAFYDFTGAYLVQLSPSFA
jgi:hypothetical protein